MSVPRSVNDLCKQHNITAEQIADQTGLDRQRVLAIVLGRWTPSPQEREKVSSVFNVPKEEIAWGHKTPIQHIYGHGPS